MPPLYNPQRRPILRLPLIYGYPDNGFGMQHQCCLCRPSVLNSEHVRGLSAVSSLAWNGLAARRRRLCYLSAIRA